MIIKQWCQLIGKTIINVELLKNRNTDDSGFVKLTFSDGDTAIVAGGYGRYTGDSNDEFPTKISLLGRDDFLVQLDGLDT